MLPRLEIAGYRGAYTVEIFSLDVPDSLYDGDIDAVIRRSQAGMAAAWATELSNPHSP